MGATAGTTKGIFTQSPLNFGSLITPTAVAPKLDPNATSKNARSSFSDGALEEAFVEDFPEDGFATNVREPGGVGLDPNYDRPPTSMCPIDSHCPSKFYPTPPTVLTSEETPAPKSLRREAARDQYEKLFLRLPQRRISKVGKYPQPPGGDRREASPKVSMSDYKPGGSVT